MSHTIGGIWGGDREVDNDVDCRGWLIVDRIAEIAEVQQIGPLALLVRLEPVNLSTPTLQT